MRTIGPAGMFSVGSAWRFHHWDPSNGHLTFLGDEVDVHDVTSRMAVSAEAAPSFQEQMRMLNASQHEDRL